MTNVIIVAAQQDATRRSGARPRPEPERVEARRRDIVCNM